MKKTNQSISGTSFHTITIDTTPETLLAVADKLQADYFECNDGQDKTNFEFMFETSEGDVFTIYDWKYGHELIMNERITFNIGSRDMSIAMTAKEELTKFIVEMQGDAVLDRYIKLDVSHQNWLDQIEKDNDITIIN